MKETLKKLTEEVKAKMMEVLQSAEMDDFIKKTKAATNSGSFEVIISTADIDRQGESIDQGGWDLTHYRSNPVVLWGHDYYSLPIGITEDIQVKDGRLVARGRFAPAEANPFAQQVRRLYDLKIVRATSVGFIARDIEEGIITKAELLEFSFVGVPANPHALTLGEIKEFGLDLETLKAKGLELKTKEEKEESKAEDSDDAGPTKEELEQIEKEEATQHNKSDKSDKNVSVKFIKQQAIEQLKKAIAAVEKIEGGEGEDLPDGAAPKERSGTAGEAVVKELDDFLMAQRVLRTVTTAASNALEQMNKRMREGKVRK